MPSPWVPSGGGGGVTAVTGTPPIASSGGTTPDISINPAAIGSIAPINYVWVVTANTIPKGTPDGSWSSPFATINQARIAFNALTPPAGSVLTLLLCDTAYSGATLPSGYSVCLIGQVGQTFVGNVSWNDGGSTDTLTLTAQDCSMSKVTFTGAGTGGLVYSHFSSNPQNDCGNLDASGYSTLIPVLLNGSLMTQGFVGDNLKLTGKGVLSGGGPYQLDSIESYEGGQAFGTQWVVQSVGNEGFQGTYFFGGGTFDGPANSMKGDALSIGSFQAAGATLVGAATYTFTEPALGVSYDDSLSPQLGAGQVQGAIDALKGQTAFSSGQSLLPFMYGEKSIGLPNTTLSLTFDMPAGSTVHVFTASDTTHTTAVSDDVNGSYGAALDTITDVANGDRIGQYSKVGVTGGRTTVTATATAGNQFQAIAVFVIPPTGAVDGHTGQLQVTPGTGANAITTGPATNANAPAIMIAMCQDDSASVSALPGEGFTGWYLAPGGGDGDTFTANGGSFMSAGWGYGGLATSRFEFRVIPTPGAQEATFTTQQPADDFISLMAMYPVPP